MPLRQQAGSKSRPSSTTKHHQHLDGQETQKAPKQQHRNLQQQQQHQQQPNVKDCKCLGLQLHQGSPVISYIFIKRQKAIEGHSNVSNALYVTGLPLGLDETALEAIFQLFGEVGNVVMHPSKVSCRTLAGQRFGPQCCVLHALSPVKVHNTKYHSSTVLRVFCSVVPDAWCC